MMGAVCICGVAQPASDSGEDIPPTLRTLACSAYPGQRNCGGNVAGEVIY